MAISCGGGVCAINREGACCVGFEPAGCNCDPRDNLCKECLDNGDCAAGRFCSAQRCIECNNGDTRCAQGGRQQCTDEQFDRLWSGSRALSRATPWDLPVRSRGAQDICLSVGSCSLAVSESCPYAIPGVGDALDAGSGRERSLSRENLVSPAVGYDRERRQRRSD